MKKCLLMLLSFVLLTGCVSVVKCPPSGAWGPEVQPLGLVKADSGGWPLSLRSTPSDYTFYSALREKAEKQFGVSKNDVVLGEVTVNIGAEMDGTIRDWSAQAMAGRTNTTIQPISR